MPPWSNSWWWWTILGYLCLAIGRHGKPGRIRTDNEVIFTSFVITTFLKLVGSAWHCPVEIIVKKLLAAGGERQHALMLKVA